MTRVLLWVLPATGLVGALLGTALPWEAAAVFSLGIGAAAATLVWRREQRRIGRLATRVNRWLGDDVGREPLELRGGQSWRDLAVSINALGLALEHAEEAAQQSEPWRDAIVSALMTPALLTDSDGRVAAANRAAQELLGLRMDTQPTLLQAVGSAAVTDAANEARETGRRVAVEAAVGEHDLHITVSPVGDELLVLVTDQSRERRVEDLRRNFVVNASHELKTPATSIQTLTEALEVAVDRDPQRARRLVERLGEEAHRLVHIVHDLLDLRRLEESGPVERVPVDLAAVCRTVVAGLDEQFRDREVEAVVEAPDQAIIAGVPDDVELIVRNLVANAIQYNQPSGKVEVRLSRDDGQYRLDVRDDGIGIPQQDLQRIFERFYRVDVARSRKTGGTGLGLSIVRHAVERHGGKVTVDSLLGEGTTFTVVLPVEPPE